MAARVLVEGQDTVTFDIDIERSDVAESFLVGGPDVEAFKKYVHLQGGGWAAGKFDVSCELGTLRGCSMDGDIRAPGASFTCFTVEPPASSG